jgi:DNA ligase (NAD+)
MESSPKYTGKTVKIRKPVKNTRYNEKLIALMDELATYMIKRGEPFRSRAYKKAEESIVLFPQDITSANFKSIGLEELPGVGETIMKKIEEYIETGTLRVLERERADPQNILTDVYGIGPKKAKDLVEKGVTTIAQLRETQEELLNSIQKTGLRYYEDILQRIPRSEIDTYSRVFERAFDKIKDSDSRYEIVGSYRRGNKTSGDIDVIITSHNNAVFKEFIDRLLQEGVIVEVLSRGPTKSLVIAKLPDEKHARRVDFLYTSPEEYPFAVLYFTGSKIFNTVMRGRALNRGYSLNEHGLYVMDGKNKGGKVDHMFENERDIFRFLNMDYKEPEERQDGRAVVPIKGTLLLAPQNITKKIRKTKDDKERMKREGEEKQAKLKQHKEEEIRIKRDQKQRLKEVKKADTERKQMETRKKREEARADAREEKQKQRELEKQLKASRKTRKRRDSDMPSLKRNISCPKIPPLPNCDEDSVVEAIQNFKDGGLSVLNRLHEDTLVSMMERANEVYRNLGPDDVVLMSDNQYDILEDFIKRKYPKNKKVGKIGAPVERNKVTLPYQMASMDKIKPDTKALSSWKAKYTGPYVLSCKLDGVSGLYSTENGEPKLYTRGDGKVGQDISHFIPYLQLPTIENAVVRGEFIMKKSVFESKYKDHYANPRNLVAGTVNRLTVNDIIHDIDFVTYEVVKPELKPSEQMEFLHKHQFNTVLNETRQNINNDELSELLVKWRRDYLYEIDGVIVINDKIYPRKSGNPDHAFAFKMVLSDQMAEAMVVDVHWKASKDGYLKPRVQIEPVHLGGVKIEYATGFNGAFIESNRIGVGTFIKIIRSGDVIPYIKEVITPSNQGKMPDVPYVWNETHIDILLEDKESDVGVLEKNITGFFKGIAVDGLSEGNVKRIMEAGFDSIPKIIRMTKEDFLTIEGFKEKMASKIHGGIETRIREVSLPSFMSASNMLGRGFSTKKIELIMEEYPDILTSQESLENKKKKLAEVKGMASKSAAHFVDHIPNFMGFLQDTGLQGKLNTRTSSPKPAIDEGHVLFKKTIVMSGTRDKELETDMERVGAILGSSVSSNTFAVITPDLETTSSKVINARKLDIPILTPAEVRSKFLS